MSVEDVVTGGEGGSLNEKLTQVVESGNAMVAELQEATDLLVEKAAQLAHHEVLMGTRDDPGHIKVGVGFERTDDGTVNVIGTEAFKLDLSETMEAHDAPATAADTGHVKPDGDTLTVGPDGTLSVRPEGIAPAAIGALAADGKAVNAAQADTAPKLTTARTLDGVNFNGTANVTHYATCSTEAATVEKAVDLAGFVLASGARVAVRFTVTNTAANATLNVNATGARPIRYRNAALAAGYPAANRTYEFVYDGVAYQVVGDINTDTKYAAGTGLSLTGTTFAAKFGTTGGTVAQGNDERLVQIPGIVRRVEEMEAGGGVTKDATPPADTGRLWLNTVDGTLNYHDGKVWKPVVARYVDA